MSGVTYQDAKQVDNTGLWYKFGRDQSGNLHILCSGDQDSLERNSVIGHTHYWQSNGKWYCQERIGNTHAMNADAFIEGIERENQRGSLNLTDTEKQALNLTSSSNQLTNRQVKQLAEYRTNQAYGNAGYGNNKGVELSASESQTLDRLANSNYQPSTTNLTWRDPEDTTTSDSTQNKLTWRDSTPNTNSCNSPNNQIQQSNQKKTQKSTRKTTR